MQPIGRLPRALAAVAALAGLPGCVATVPVRATAYDIGVRLDPETHALAGQTTLTLHLDSAQRPDDKPIAVEFTLNRALEIRDLRADDATLGGHSARRLKHGSGGDSASSMNVHRVILKSAADEFSLTVDYDGKLFQDVAAGEKEGAIHNFLMSAHVDTEGVYLAADGGWYPSPHNPDEDEAQGELADYRLTVEPVEGLELVASATPVHGQPDQPEGLVWRSTYPLDGMALVGGPHLVKVRQSGETRITLHYTPSDDADTEIMMDEHTDMFLDAADTYLKRYEPLIGPYPFKRFAIVENFFSSGFAFPEFTLLNRVLLEMGPNGLKHGYLDHEMLHAWWGNSIYVDPADGNWCEGLASYGANYYGFILDGDEEGARKKRRDCCNFLSRVKPENDKPLGQFGREGGPGRGIGYSKGTMVFHMLARRVGQDNFWAAIRRLTAEYTGKYASWETFKTLFEEQSGMNLCRFFTEWVRSGGAPNLKLVDAVWRSDTQTLEVTINQGKTAFELAVPLRFEFADGTHSDHIAEMGETEATIAFQLDQPPTSVILDPDYHVFRKLQPAEIMPTAGITAGAKELLVIKPDGDVSDFYQRVSDRFSDDKKPRTITHRTVSELSPGDLTGGSILILGDAARNEHVQDLLARTDCPITWQESGFSIEGTAYDQPEHSVICTVHHPDVPGSGITIYDGNSEDALGRSDLLLYYGNSLVVFGTTAKVVEDEKEYQSKVLQRMDFESQEQIAVQQ